MEVAAKGEQSLGVSATVSGVVFGPKAALISDGGYITGAARNVANKIVTGAAANSGGVLTINRGTISGNGITEALQADGNNAVSSNSKTCFRAFIGSSAKRGLIGEAGRFEGKGLSHIEAVPGIAP
jgi:hypothetical protein